VGGDAPPLVAELLTRCRFPSAGTAAACAVSGGADSLALLALAVAAGLDATAIHVDHGLRSGSADEAEVVRAAAASLGAGFEAVRVDVEPGPNLEARARAARYAALPDGVLTGHTADDQAETVLLNLLRGAGIDGLGAMRAAPRPGERGPVRPLLGLRRSETRALCADLGLVPLDDPSNADPRHRRNRVRHELIPMMNAVAERDVVPLLARLADLAGADAALLDEAAAELDVTDAKEVAAAPEALARRALRAWLRHGAERHPPDAATVERVLAVARGLAEATEAGGGRRVVRSHGRLRIEGPSGAH
jgi:tRNA(Ile)-lysidine synthase